MHEVGCYSLFVSKLYLFFGFFSTLRELDNNIGFTAIMERSKIITTSSSISSVGVAMSIAKQDIRIHLNGKQYYDTSQVVSLTVNPNSLYHPDHRKKNRGQNQIITQVTMMQYARGKFLNGIKSTNRLFMTTRFFLPSLGYCELIAF